MISIEKCEAYLTSAKPWERKKLTLRRATAVMAVCHAWLALSDAVREYETIVGEEDAPQALERLAESHLRAKRMDGPR